MKQPRLAKKVYWTFFLFPGHCNTLKYMPVANCISVMLLNFSFVCCCYGYCCYFCWAWLQLAAKLFLRKLFSEIVFQKLFFSTLFWPSQHNHCLTTKFPDHSGHDTVEVSHWFAEEAAPTAPQECNCRE